MEFDKIITKENAKNLSSVVLAFVGDAVYSLFIRKKLSTETDLKSGELSQQISKIVCATAQAKLVQELLPLLNEDEADVYRRARNSKKPSKSKHSTVSEYNKSTGFEALIGYLYLTGNTQRLNFILNFGEKNED